jgi:hypothetical protein
MSQQRNTLSQIADLLRSHGISVTAVHPESDEYDAEITLTPTIHIQVISSTEFCLVEEVKEGEFQFSATVDLTTVIRLAKEALRLGPNRNN